MISTEILCKKADDRIIHNIKAKDLTVESFFSYRLPVKPENLKIESGLVELNWMQRHIERNTS